MVSYMKVLTLHINQYQSITMPPIPGTEGNDQQCIYDLSSPLSSYLLQESGHCNSSSIPLFN